MKRVSYVEGTFLTSDSVADALLDLVATVGRRSTATVAHVPTVGLDGAIVITDIVIGPASQIRSDPEDSLFPEPESAAALNDLAELRRTVGVSIARPDDSMPVPPVWQEEV